jgi:hypothetical protein
VKHPADDKLALYAGGDLGVFERWRVRSHLNGCETCRSEIARFEAAGEVLTDEGARMPEGLDWGPLSRDMAANIRLGLAAGEIVASTGNHSPAIAWRPAAVVASATALLITAWWLNVPAAPPHDAQQQQALAVQPLLQETDSGIEVRSGRGSLSLLRPRTASAALQVSAPGSLRERYVDDETGQVTINNVYAE